MPATASRMPYKDIRNRPIMSVNATSKTRKSGSRSTKISTDTSWQWLVRTKNTRGLQEIFLLSSTAIGGPRKHRVFKSDIKLKTLTSSKTVFDYPDIIITCSSKGTNDLNKQHATLSIEAACYERKRNHNDKLTTFLSIPSLKEDVVVWPNPKKPRVTIFRPETSLKPAEEHRRGSFTLQSVKFTMNLADIYAA